MSANCIEEAHKYSVENNVKGYINIYNKLLEKD